MRCHNIVPFKKIFDLMFMLVLLCPLSVFGHAVMVDSTPEKDSTITTSPTQIDVWFNEHVRSEHKALAVINSSGKRVDNKDIKQEPFDPSHIYVTTPKLPPDTYTVRYRVVSADTHVVSGRFSFTIEAPK